MELCRATYQELGAISGIARRADMWCYPSFVYAILIFFSCMLVLKKKKRVIGYICYMTLPIVKLGYIIQIALHPDHQKKQLGGFMLDWTTHYLKETNHITRLALHTLKKPVMHWMQKRNFRTACSYGDSLWVMHKEV